jgi:hypothetical protein
MNAPIPDRPDSRSGPDDSDRVAGRAPRAGGGGEPDDVMDAAEPGEPPDPFPDDEYEPL